jgi:hypothetical protein
VVSGEFCTMPNGVAAPGTTKPGAAVPIMGSTRAARSTLPARAPGGTTRGMAPASSASATATRLTAAQPPAGSGLHGWLRRVHGGSGVGAV